MNIWECKWLWILWISCWVCMFIYYAQQGRDIRVPGSSLSCRQPSDMFQDHFTSWDDEEEFHVFISKIFLSCYQRRDGNESSKEGSRVTAFHSFFDAILECNSFFAFEGREMTQINVNNCHSFLVWVVCLTALTWRVSNMLPWDFMHQVIPMRLCTHWGVDAFTLE